MNELMMLQYLSQYFGSNLTFFIFLPYNLTIRTLLHPAARLPHAERAVRGRVPGGAVLPGEERPPRGLHPLLLHLPDMQRVQRLRGEFGERPMAFSHFDTLKRWI